MKRKNLLRLITIVSLFLLAGCQSEKGEYPFKKREIPLLEARGVKLVGWNEKGEKSWELQADSEIEFTGRITLDKVKIYLLEKEKLVSEGKAEKAVVDSQTYNILLIGEVKLVSHLDGAELFTPQLEWIASDKKLHTEERIILKRKNLTIEGWGLIANPSLAQITIKREALTRLREIGG